MSNTDTGETFWKLKTFIDICYGKRERGLNHEEVLSIFYTNFTGKEIMEFKKAQGSGKNANRG